MKTLLKLLLLLASAATAGAMSFQDALSGGHISCSGSATNGYAETTLTVTNRRTYSVTVDFTTVSFVQNNATQRIGLSYELSTRGYNLVLAASRTYTLRFSSRCLDHSRSAPYTGTAIASYAVIPSQFSFIVNALRNKYSQADVWALTDASTAWLQSDPRYVPPTPATPRIDLSGTNSWSISGSSFTLYIGRIANYGSGTSGSLRIRAWASRTRYTGGALNGYVLGSYSLGTLSGGYSFANFSRTVSYSRPPAGTYWTVLTVEEYTSSGWVIRDYENSGFTVRL